jgi:hypothetical protein
LMLLMAISLMMIIIIFYPNLSKGVLKLSWILNNNRLPVNAVESSVDPLLHKS